MFTYTILLSCYMTRWLPDIWCCNSVFNSPNTDMLITWYQYVYTSHLIPDIWYLTQVLNLLSLDTWQLTWYHLILDIRYHLVLTHLTWCCDIWLDTTTLTPVLHCVFMIITFTGTWHDYYIVTRHLVLLNSYGHYHWTISNNWTTYTRTGEIDG